MLDTEFETLSQSDVESNYMTGLEDFAGNEPSKPKEELVPKKLLSCADELCHTSSFVQNILYEDSRTGIAVVDLFVAVKMVKDNLDILTRCNNQLFYKINHLNEESRVIRTEYRNLLKMMLEFLDKMNADSLIWNFPMLRRKSSTAAYISEDYPKLKETECLRNTEEGLGKKKVEISQKEQIPRPRWEESETESQAVGRDGAKGKHLRRRYGNRCRRCKKRESKEVESKHTCRDIKGKKTDVNCLGCFMSAFKEIPFHQLPIIPEALLGSFLASFLWLLREQERTIDSPKSSKSPCRATSTLKKEKESDESFGSVNLSESTIQMICDVCEILNEATFQELESKELPYISLKKAKQAEDLDLENWVSCGSRFRGRCRSPSSKITASIERVDFKRNFLKEVPTLCSGTCSSPSCLNHEKKTESNESSKAAVEAADESSSENESDFVEALTRPLTPLLQSDLKSPSVSCMGDLTKIVLSKKSASTLTATNNILTSCVGRLSDEIQSKIRKIKSKTNVKLIERAFEKSDDTSNRVRTKFSGGTQFTVTANTPVGVYDVTVVQYKKNRFSDRICSEDSFRNSDSEPVWADSNSVAEEDDLEEFLEIYVGNSKKKNGKVAPLQEKGVLKKTELKTHKAHFFEIQRYHPVYFVQEIIKKTPVVHPVLCLEKVKSRNAINEENEIVFHNAGDKQKKQVVFEGSSSDIVIYIQVEIEEGWSPKSGALFIQNQMNSLGTQTVEDKGEHNLLSDERVIKLNEGKQHGESLFHIWKGCRVSRSEEIKQKKKITFHKSLPILGKLQVEMKEEQPEEACVDDEEVLAMQEIKEKMTIFDEELSEMYIESEICETYPDDEEEEEEKEEEEKKEKITVMGTADLLFMKEERQQTNTWFPQNEVMHKLDFVILQQVPEVSSEFEEMINNNAVELAKALKLIHEIESDIIDVKLDDAISILPRLESELRKHLQSKFKSIGGRDSGQEVSIDNFFSTLDFWQEEEPAKKNDDASQERLNNLLKLLSNLEEAVKLNEHSRNKRQTCQFGFSKIYELLHALTVNIRQLEEHPNVTSLSQTLDVASQLDTAVRECDNIINKQPLDYVSPSKKVRRKSKSLEEIPVKCHLKNVRKKVFEIVEEEAFNLEGKIEIDFDRLDRIEKENNEAMMFLEAFLQKTERRMIELSDVKSELKDLSFALNTMYETCRETVAKRREKEMETGKRILQRKEPEERSASIKSAKGLSPTVKKEFVRETVSGLLVALDSLKSRAREKKEFCKEILSSAGFEKVQDSESSSRRSSRSSFTAKHADNLTSSVKECKKIGSTSLYLSWTEPEGFFKDHVLGYQIYVNGKLNQKVRNPQRLQAVLYSIDFTKETQVQLYALAESHPKILLATLGYPNE